MRKIIIEGGNSLKGEIKIQGSKNSVLPILAASILCDECLIHNCPKIIDVDITIEILKYLGCETEFNNSTLKINSKNLNKNNIPEFLMRKMRSSIIFLGALISKTSSCELSLPGGCELGPRPIDIHIQGLKQMGIEINEFNGKIKCRVNKKNKNNKIMLPFPSVGATQNLMLASVSSENGITIIQNAAREPEIIDLANFLTKMGVKIIGAGQSDIQIEGTNEASQVEHCIIPDRIVATSYLCAAAITGGNINIHANLEDNIDSVIPILEESGCFIKKYDNNLQIISPERLNSVKNIRTMPYPGFPTDAQALIMAMLMLANGTSVLIETIFQSRYKHVGELLRFGSKISVQGNLAIVEGVKKITGSHVRSTDLRGAAALVIGALAANGESMISDIYHLERGYEDIKENLKNLGATIKYSN